MSPDILGQDTQRICECVDFQPLHSATILVTGASGLMGTHFLGCLGRLRQQGMPLEIYAQWHSDPPPHITDLARRGAFKVLRLDLADFAAYRRLPAADFIIHAAGYGQPGRFLANPAGTLQINTSATLALLRRLRQKGRFLFLSSSEVYSGLDKAQPNEADIGTTTPAHPRAAYIEGKRAGEAFCHAFRAQGVSAVSARLALAYGPGTRPGDQRVINCFIQQALRNKVIRLLDQGMARRTYCYVADAVYMLWRILLEGREACYNVGGDSRTTILQLAQLIGQCCQAPVEIPTGSNTGVQGAPQDVRLDLNRFTHEFGPVPFVDLTSGVARTLEWQRASFPQIPVRSSASRPLL